MPKSTNPVYTIPGATPQERRFHGYSELSHKQVDSKPERITTNFRFENAVGDNLPQQNSTDLNASREAQVLIHRDDLENIFNPQPSKDQIVKMMEEISAYLMQEGVLLHGFREEEVGK